MFDKAFGLQSEGFILAQNGETLGLLAPSTIFGIDNDGIRYFWGPKGISRIRAELGIDQVINALELCGSILKGTEGAIRTVNNLLLDPRSSRTTSYFACNGMSCNQIAAALQNIERAHIAIIGCGGIGSSVAMLLAGAGVNKLTLVDGDVIEQSNLNRQLFWTKSDIDQPKVTTLHKRIAERFDDCEVTTIAEQITKASILSIGGTCDGLVITADEPISIVSESPEIARTLNIPVVSSGYMHSKAMAFCFPGNTNFVLKTNEDKDFWQRFPQGVMPSFGPTNMALAAHISSSLLNVIVRDKCELPSVAVRWDTAVQPHQFATEIL